MTLNFKNISGRLVRRSGLFVGVIAYIVGCGLQVAPLVQADSSAANNNGQSIDLMQAARNMASTTNATSTTADPDSNTGLCTNNACADADQNCSNDSCDFIGKYINPAIDLLSLTFGVIAVISIITGGIQYTASAGDPQKASMAKSRITNTIIAIFAYLFLYAFLEFLVPGGIFKS
jgi:hypothetical protein